MNKTLILGLLIASQASFAAIKEDEWGEKSHIEVGISVSDLSDSQHKIEQLLTQHPSIKVLSRNISKSAEVYGRAENLHYDLQGPDSLMQIARDSIAAWGTVTTNTSELSLSRTNTIEWQTELSKLDEEIKELRADLARLNPEGDNWHNLHAELKEDLEKQSNYQNGLLRLKLDSGKTLMRIDIEPKIVLNKSVENVGWFEFANMPGAQFVTMKMTGKNSSSELYTGVGAKYMFFKAKSYIEFNDLRPYYSDARYDQVMTISFGSDFYSRFLGQGTLTFGNLYSGFDGGEIFASSNGNYTNSFYIAPHLGLELIHWNMLIVDTRAAWLIPLSSTSWSKLQGIQLTAGANLIF